MNSPLTYNLSFSISAFTVLGDSYWSCLSDLMWYLMIPITTQDP